MLKSTLCDYSDAYIPVKGIASVTTGAAANNNHKQVIFKNYAQFTDSISEINNTQIDHAKDVDVVMSMYSLIEYSKNYLKTSANLYYRDVRALPNTGTIDDYPFNSASFKFKQKNNRWYNKIINIQIINMQWYNKYTNNINTQIINKNGTKNVDIMIPLKYLSNFWRTPEM